MKPISKIDQIDRPREKLKERGPAALTDEELVAAILGMGIQGRDVSAISRDVAELIRKHRAELNLELFKEIPGMGLAKAAQILSAFELARRHLLQDKVKVTKPEDILPLLADISGKMQEHFVCITLNGAHEVIEKRIVTVGLLNQSQVHPREVFADALTDRAAAVIFAHNHPSGNLDPSTADIEVQRQLESAARILGLRVLDHLIVSKKGFYSFQEHGLLGSGD